MKLLEKKTKAYKQAFLDQREIRRCQEKTIKEYEYVIDCMTKRKLAV